MSTMFLKNAGVEGQRPANHLRQDDQVTCCSTESFKYTLAASFWHGLNNRGSGVGGTPICQHNAEMSHEAFQNICEQNYQMTCCSAETLQDPDLQPVLCTAQKRRSEGLRGVGMIWNTTWHHFGTEALHGGRFGLGQKIFIHCNPPSPETHGNLETVRTLKSQNPMVFFKVSTVSMEQDLCSL